MDEYELDRVGTNNPALWPPTSQGTPVQRSKSRNSQGTNAPPGSNDDVIPEEEEYPSKYDVNYFPPAPSTQKNLS